MSDTTKTAGFSDMLGKAAIPATLVGAALIKSSLEALKHDIRRKRILEELSWDPDLKNLDKTKLAEWYATINHYAPTTALNKTATKSLLKQFSMFGGVDMQTLKTLAEVEDKQQSAASRRNDWVSWVK